MKLDYQPVRKRARVEIIPMIDCVFILLVFFIYSMLAMTIRRGIVVQLPQAQMIQTAREEAVVVTVTADGGLLVDDLPVALEQLGPAVDNALAALAEPLVIVNADAGSQHRWFVHVIDELRARGISQVVILSEEPAPP